MEQIKTKNFAKSVLKSAAVTLSVQALGKNLKKDNIGQTLLVIAAGGLGDYFGGNTAMGAILGGGNALINKTNFLGTATKYAAIGGAVDLLLNATEAKAEPNKNTDINRNIDPHGFLNRKGVNFLHVHCTNIKEATYEEQGSADFNFTSDKLEYKTLISAFELAKKTKSVQSVLKTFENNANALFFIESDISDREVYGTAESYPRDAKYSYSVTPKSQNTIVKNHSTLYWVVRITIYPNELLKLSVKDQIAHLAVTIGHELFIHSKHIETVELWEQGKYSDAVLKALEDTGFNGNIDHKLYMSGNKQRMNGYLKELRNAAANSNITVYNIDKAITEHNNNYKHLVNR